MCPDAAKLRIAPLQDEEDLKILFDKNVVTNVAARVPPTSQVPVANNRASGSRINIEEDDSGCEGEEEPLATPVRPHGQIKRSCPYSPSPMATPKMSTGSSSASKFERMMELMEMREKSKLSMRLVDQEKSLKVMEEEKSKGSVTSPAKESSAKESSRDEIRRLVALVYQDGAKPGSLEYFYATQLFLLQHYREMFACLVEDATDRKSVV